MNAYLLLLNLHHGDGLLLRLFSLALFLAAAERFDALNKFKYLRYPIFFTSSRKTQSQAKKQGSYIGLCSHTTHHQPPN